MKSKPAITPPDQLYPPWRLRLPWLALSILLILLSSRVRAAPTGPDVIGFDKLAHFFVFGLLGTLIFRSLRGDLRGRRRLWLATLAVASVGGLDEILQHFNPHRSADLYDWVADTAGAMVAILVYRGWDWYRWLLEYPLWGRLAKASPVSSNSPP